MVQRPSRAAIPVHRASVVVVQARFVLAIDGRARVPRWAVLDGLAGHADVNVALTPTDAACPARGNQNALSKPPIARVDHEVAHFPGLIVHDEVFDAADRSVASLDLVAADRAGAAQMDVSRPV